MRHLQDFAMPPFVDLRDAPAKDQALPLQGPKGLLTDTRTIVDKP